MGFPVNILLVNAFSKPAEFGFSLPIVYLVWLAIILAIHPVCKWFAGIKTKRKKLVAILFVAHPYRYF
ncbi:hypothetical protein H0A36_00565 [Endozoicomonas sp. SM1973]|uniref:Uncharacterized protein n=1 Tax=Spartinivicinus marinus TaxID=2994442 RepID=A0A853I4G3_9GAMM|nr:hypothetical protein [Spartinivicinus marinus]MCX4026643.1 hypothetical protein [Spartinivicinus marinus]NYZ64477.1 hypothetical protein [Spartinivicinus marinus]